MSATDLSPRPRQLMLAAGVVIGGSAFLVAAVFDALANLQSVDAREQLQKVISSSAGRELGVTLDQAINAVRAALNLTAVCAAIAVVLGIFVLQRHRGARIGLTIVAIPLLVTAPLVGGFLGALVAVATLMLWSGPAGDWYAGRPIRQTSGEARREREARPSPSSHPSGPAQPPSPPPPDQPSTLDTSTAPGATQDFGAPVDPFGPPPPETQPQAPPQAQHETWPPGLQQQPSAPSGGPGPAPVPVRVACLLTAVFSGLVALLYLAALVALLLQRDAIVDRVLDAPAWRDAGLPDDSLVPMLWFGVLLFLAWSLGAIVLAWFTWRRHDWARYVLVVSAGVTFLVGLIAFPVGLVHQIACVATIACLFSARSRAWFAGRAPTPPVKSGPW